MAHRYWNEIYETEELAKAAIPTRTAGTPYSETYVNRPPHQVECTDGKTRWEVCYETFSG